MDAINLEAGDYLAGDGVIYPIVAYVGADGKETEWFNAVTLVAGAGDKWFPLTVAEFRNRPT